jgi:hypothetical protein
MDTLATAMQTKTRLNDCREKAIIGKLGDIVSGTRNGIAGYYVGLLFATARKLHEVLKRFKCGEITAEGDTEAVLFLSRENALSRAEDLRTAIKARKRPKLTTEQRRGKAVKVLQVRPKPDHLMGLAA